MTDIAARAKRLYELMNGAMADPYNVTPNDVGECFLWAMGEIKVLRDRLGAADGAGWQMRFQIDAMRPVLKAALSLIEDEAENRSAGGSEMSAYEREPRELAERIRALLP